MKRRTFISGITFGFLAAPLASEAQRPGKVYRIGFLAGGPTPPVEEFRRCIRELGYIEGTNTVVERRWTGGRVEMADQLAAELVGLAPDVLVALTAPPAVAMKRATRKIPIVFAAVTDPVAVGLVSSLGRPGGNVTGVSWDVTPATTGKALEIFKEAVPGLHRLAALWNPTFRGSEAWVAKVKDAGQTLGVAVTFVGADSSQALDSAFDDIAKQRFDGLFVLADPLTVIHRVRIVDFAARRHLPDMHIVRDFVNAGGLMSYGPNLAENICRAAYYVDRILKGAKSGDLPVEQPTKFELVINLKTAKALGLTIPQSLLSRADEIIQ